MPLPTSLARNDPTAQRGAVIVMVLVLLTLASLLLGRFMERAMTEMLVESRARQADRLRGEAHSALEATLAVLAEYRALDNGLHSPAQGWGEPLTGLTLPTEPGLAVEVAVKDETARPSLPRLEAPALIALGREIGLTEPDARALADALLVWTHGGMAGLSYETDPRRYEYETPPHQAPGRPLESFDELASIAVARRLFYTPAGQPTPLRDAFVRRVSLQDFPTVNLNAAEATTLAWAGWDDTLTKRLEEWRRGRGGRAPGAPPYFRSLAEAQAWLGAAAPLTGFDTLAHCLRVEVTVRAGATALQLAAVVSPREPRAEQPTEEPDVLRYPFILLALQENLQLTPPPSLL